MTTRNPYEVGLFIPIGGLHGKGMFWMKWLTILQQLNLLVPDQMFVQKKIEKSSQQLLPESGSICRVLEVLLSTLPQVIENL